MTETSGDQAPRPGGVFVGRERELSLLAHGLDEAAAGRGSLVLLAGEPGLGKSRLADELDARAREQGFIVLWGRCWEAGGAPAYWPWVQALRSYVRATDPNELAEILGPGIGHVAQMLPDVLTAVRDVHIPEVGDPDSARFLLFDATTSFLLNAAARQPVLLVLDDLQSADTASLLLLRFVAGSVNDARLLILGLYRDRELDPEHPLSQTLTELRRQPACSIQIERFQFLMRARCDRDAG